MRVALLAAALPATAADGVAAQSTEAPVVAGACKLNVVLSSVPTVGVLPAQPTWSVNGSGSCAVAPGATVETGTLTGSLVGVAATSAGCAAGAYRGNLTFDVPAALAEVDSFAVAAVMAGAGLEIAMVSANTFVGAGAFAQTSTPATATCPTVGNTQTTWKGVFAFEGPPPSSDALRPDSGSPT